MAKVRGAGQQVCKDAGHAVASDPLNYRWSYQWPTLAQWRGRGIYRALVSYRARLAVARGFTHLQVDASDDSRPILERNGFIPVTTTTPYVHTPW